jgi:hypothetical protein
VIYKISLLKLKKRFDRVKKKCVFIVSAVPTPTPTPTPTKRKKMYFTKKEIKLIESIKASALKKYEKGGQFIIECLEDGEILAYFDSVREANHWMKIKAEQRQEIEYTIW